MSAPTFWNTDAADRDARRFKARERVKRGWRRWSIVSQVRNDIAMCHSYGVERSKHAVY